MRRLVVILFAIVLVLGLSVNAFAAPTASSIRTVASVSADESCDVTMMVTLDLDTPLEDLTFPVPADATNITVNGSRVGASQTRESRNINIARMTGGMAGTFSFTVNYRLDDVIGLNEDGLLEMELPLLAGFAYPVEDYEFSITFPGPIAAKPAFSSGYHKSNIEQDLRFTTDGATVTGSSQKALKDRETLTMILTVTADMFPQTMIQLQDFDLMYLLMGICGALALLYWIIFLRCLPPRRVSVTAPTDGFTAGQLGTILSVQGANLTMMVLSWAQLGYLLIRYDRKGRVTLHKTMEMGNERSTFERRCFSQLFGKRTQVDTSGTQYAQQFRKTELFPPNVFGLIQGKSGSPKIFRSFAALVGLFGGVCLGMVLGLESSVQLLIVILLALFGLMSCWLIQSWADDLFLLGKQRLITAALLILCWVGLSLLAGMLNMGLWICGAQLLVGLMSAFGCRRTDAGRQAMSETLALRRYLTSIPRAQLLHICQLNPNYFHDLAPYALALGVDRRFAKRFGKLVLPACPYLVTGADDHLTAAKWSKRMRKAIRAMDARRRQLPLERIMHIVESFRK